MRGEAAGGVRQAGLGQGGAAAALQDGGEKWTLVVLREVFNGVRCFDDMRVRTG